jgi:hypothetical protein
LERLGSRAASRGAVLDALGGQLGRMQEAVGHHLVEQKRPVEVADNVLQACVNMGRLTKTREEIDKILKQTRRIW